MLEEREENKKYDEWELKAFLPNLAYTTLCHPNGITRPNVWIGHFSKFELSRYQKNLFDVLRKEGFKRTPFQVVEPEQNAGLIKRLSESDRQIYSLDEWIDEAHIRFYLNGAISCELEPNRFSEQHYNEGIDGSRYLENLVNKNELLSPNKKENIISQIEFQDVRDLYTGNENNIHYLNFKAAYDITTITAVTAGILLLWQEIVAPAIFVSGYCMFDKIFEIVYNNTNFFQAIQ